MSSEHKRPLYAFVVLTLVCGVFMGYSVKAQALIGSLLSEPNGLAQVSVAPVLRLLEVTDAPASSSTENAQAANASAAAASGAHGISAGAFDAARVGDDGSTPVALPEHAKGKAKGHAKVGKAKGHAKKGKAKGHAKIGKAKGHAKKGKAKGHAKVGKAKGHAKIGKAKGHAKRSG
ncbi:MAG TPA: hypothetical protein VIR30_07790 [Nocardioides sp.]